jgi:hypothetical protein
MAPLLDVGLRPSEPTNQEISEALLGTLKVLRRVHRSQKVVLRDLSIEGRHQARETLRPNHGINFDLLHVLGLLIGLAGFRALDIPGDNTSPVDRGGQVHLRSPRQALDGDDRIFRITPQTELRVPN